MAFRVKMKIRLSMEFFFGKAELNLHLHCNYHGESKKCAFFIHGASFVHLVKNYSMIYDMMIMYSAQKKVKKKTYSNPSIIPVNWTESVD